MTNKHLSKATGDHFNQKGHKVSDMEITIVEKVYSNDELFRREREKCISTNSTLSTKESTGRHNC